MAQDEPVSRKEKKVLRDAERQKKGKKRKRDEADVQDVPVQDELQQDFISLNDGVEDAQVSHKKKSRKRKAEAIQNNNSAPEVNGTSEAPTPKPKKRKKSQPTTTPPTEAPADETATTSSNKGTKPRFILFIGNLPYSTTDASLHAHFKKLAPFTLRHRTDPKTKKSKGFAFLEFENYDRMKTCLKLYHHSMFDPAKGGEEADAAGTAGVEGDGEGKKKRKDKDKVARRINVELTAGGGGKAEGRKEKIKAKNVKLDGQRKRRLEEERKEKEKEGAKKEKKAKKASGGVEVLAEKKLEPEPAKVEDDTHGIHPSRLARMQR